MDIILHLAARGGSEGKGWFHSSFLPPFHRQKHGRLEILQFLHFHFLYLFVIAFFLFKPNVNCGQLQRKILLLNILRTDFSSYHAQLVALLWVAATTCVSTHDARCVDLLRQVVVDVNMAAVLDEIKKSEAEVLNDDAHEEEVEDTEETAEGAKKKRKRKKKKKAGKFVGDNARVLASCTTHPVWLVFDGISFLYAQGRYILKTACGISTYLLIELGANFAISLCTVQT